MRPAVERHHLCAPVPGGHGVDEGIGEVRPTTGPDDRLRDGPRCLAAHLVPVQEVAERAEHLRRGTARRVVRPVSDVRPRQPGGVPLAAVAALLGLDAPAGADPAVAVTSGGPPAGGCQSKKMSGCRVSGLPP